MRVTDEAERRYHSDPILKAKASQAVLLIERERGVRLEDHDRSLATLAAACALVLADHELTTGGAFVL